MEEIQTNSSEVNSVVEEQRPAEAEQVEKINEQGVEDSQPQNKQDEIIDSNKVVMLELEEVLKSLEPEEVLKYQRELSAETGENLFEGEIGDLFKKYKPLLNREQKVKSVANLMKSNKKLQETAKTTEQDVNYKKELLETKIKLELVSNGIDKDFLEDATTVALSKIKNESDLEMCKEIAAKYSKLSDKANAKLENLTPQRTGIEVGESKNEKSDGQRAIEFLKKLNPKGFK